MLRSHKKFRTRRISKGKFKKLVYVGFPVSNTDKDGVWTLFVRLDHFFEAFEPLVAFFLLDGQTMTELLFPELPRIPSPALYVEQSQRSPLTLEHHGVMNDQPNGIVRRGAQFSRISWGSAT